MITERCIPLDRPVEWKDALKGIPHGFGHTWDNSYAMHLTTGLKTYLYCFETVNSRIVCPISERVFKGYTDIVTPYGFSGLTGKGHYSEFPHQWEEFVKQKGYICGYIALHPVFENDSFFDTDDVCESNSLYFLDLTLSSDQLFANVDRNRKRQLRSFEQASAGFTFERSTLTKFFLSNYHHFIQALDAPPANYFSKETLTYLCSLENVFMVGAGEPNKIQAVYIFAYTSYAGECLFNVPLPEGRRFATPLLWCGVHYLKSIGVPMLNLGGGIRENDSVAQSKQRFGARRVPFKSLKQVYEPEIFNKLCRLANKDPDQRSGYFPPFETPSINVVKAS